MHVCARYDAPWRHVSSFPSFLSFGSCSCCVFMFCVFCFVFLCSMFYMFGRLRNRYIIGRLGGGTRRGVCGEMLNTTQEMNRRKEMLEWEIMNVGGCLAKTLRNEEKGNEWDRWDGKGSHLY